MPNLFCLNNGLVAFWSPLSKAQSKPRIDDQPLLSRFELEAVKQG